MDIGSVCLLGGSGFVGRSIADQATERGIRVRVLTRNAARARSLTVLPTIELMEGDPSDETTLAAAFEGMDAAVNLIGVLHEKRGQSFSAVHAELPHKVGRAASAAGILHLVHVSALGASDKAPSNYQRSKAAGEAALRMGAGVVPWTILRPSVIFGEGDHFLNMFASLVKTFPVVPLAGADARFQPVWVEDVARCCVAALGDARSFGQVYELCGPRAYTLRELFELLAGLLGVHRTIVPLPPALAEMQAFTLEHMPGKLMTRDNLRSMSVPNVCSGKRPPICDYEPAAIEAVLPQYLGAASSGARYARYRNHAGR